MAARNRTAVAALGAVVALGGLSACGDDEDKSTGSTSNGVIDMAPIEAFKEGERALRASGTSVRVDGKSGGATWSGISMTRKPLCELKLKGRQERIIVTATGASVVVPNRGSAPLPQETFEAFDACLNLPVDANTVAFLRLLKFAPAKEVAIKGVDAVLFAGKAKVSGAPVSVKFYIAATGEPLPVGAITTFAQAPQQNSRVFYSDFGSTKKVRTRP